MNTLTIDNLTKVYQERRAVNGLSLEVEPGQIFGFLGPNGSGKTTTIKILLGLIRATEGRVRFFGEDRDGADLSVRRRIGAMVETPSFFTYLTARRHLHILSRIYGKVDHREIEEILDWVGLSQRADEKIKNYSLGMRQRLGLAQALLHRPEFLILDEPTNGLDPQGIVDIRNLLIRLNKEREVTVLVSSHLLTEVELLCSHVAFIHHGNLLQSGSMQKFLDESTGIMEIVVDQPDAAKQCLQQLSDDLITALSVQGNRLSLEILPKNSSAVIEALVNAKIKVYEANRLRKSLETIFLEMTTTQSEVTL